MLHRRTLEETKTAIPLPPKSTYMDDSIDSVENDDKGVEFHRQLKALWGIADMQARK